MRNWRHKLAQTGARQTTKGPYFAPVRQLAPVLIGPINWRRRSGPGRGSWIREVCCQCCGAAVTQESERWAI